MSVEADMEGRSQAAAEALCRAISSCGTQKAEEDVAPLRLFEAALSLRLALAGVPAPGFLVLSSNLLVPGWLRLIVLHQEQHTLGRVLAAGRPCLTPPGSQEADLRELATSAESAFFCTPILAAGGEAPPLGCLQLEFPSPQRVSFNDIRAAHALAAALPARHAAALAGAAEGMASLMAPLGIHQRPPLGRAAGGEAGEAEEEVGDLSGDEGISEDGLGSGSWADESLGLAAGEGGGDREDGGALGGRGAGVEGGAARGDAANGAAVNGEASAFSERLLSFRQTWNAGQVATDRGMLILSLVLHAVNWMRNRAYFADSLANGAFAVYYAAALLGTLYASLRWPAGYVEWRELPASVIPPMAFFAPCTWEASTKAVSDASLWDQGPLLGPTSFWAALVFGSMLPMLMLVPLCWTKRAVFQWAIQLLCLKPVLRQVPATCSSPLLHHPASQRQIARVHAALRRAAARLGLGLAGASGAAAAAAAGAPPEVQCKATLSTVVIVLGYLLPVALTASWEWRSYQAYVQQLVGELRRGGRAGDGALPTRGAGGTVAELARGAAMRAALVVGGMALAIGVWQVCMALYA